MFIETEISIGSSVEWVFDDALRQADLQFRRRLSRTGRTQYIEDASWKLLSLLSSENCLRLPICRSFLFIRVGLLKEPKANVRYKRKHNKAQHFVLTSISMSIYWAPATFWKR